MSEAEKKGVLDVLTEKQLHYIVARMCEPGSQIISYDLKPACEEGLAGFLGEHFRMTLCVNESNFVRKIHLFVKIVPTRNKPKADFIEQNQFFKKEALVFQLLEHIQEVNCVKPWCTKAVIHNEKMLVMPDLSIHGYKTCSSQTYFDRNHVFVSATSLARFHAAFANYFTKRNQQKPDFLEENGLIIEQEFSDSQWLLCAAKVTYNILIEFSSKAKHYPADLEEKLAQLYIQGYASLKNNGDTLNLVIHKDLWANNILFQYKNDVPINAVLIDFQLSTYAPPAFDLMSLLYLTTSNEFRDRYESEVLQTYYGVFSENLDDATKRRLQDLKYDFEGFLTWCKKARMFGMAQASATLPCVCMDPEVGKSTFDNPDTYMERLTENRFKPVVEHARENIQYRLKLLEVSEEFVGKYVLGM
ncbi:uncharacterized protein LOC123872851 [Maniola jurtina]|uniref:uncharacterized protein LOC123872851 n=1 Tax=Maniola jurtina TaxID=191418 RepID=UPI001E68ED37|nr:uncharacterized protein LOC123872851 [Maniola jurtina]